MKKYFITLKGCHDETCFFMELTDEQKEVVDEISRLSYEFSEFDCMPTLTVTDTQVSN
jgi:hypothetical protein